MFGFGATQRAMCAVVWLGLGAWTASAADSLERPEGVVILRISGDIGSTNVGEEAHFDRAMLESLGEATVETTTIWTEGVQVFSGPTMAAILSAVGVNSGTLTAIALNDYAVEIQVEDLMQGDAILAYARNGAPMPVRDKGPLWIVYPYDADPAYQTEVIYSRSIWQLDRIEVLP